MRPELITSNAKPDAGTVRAVFQLVEVTADQGAVETWTELELALAFDWAMREHLAASGNPVKRRDKPSFVTAAEKQAVHGELAARGCGTVAETGGSAVQAWDRWLAELEDSQRPVSQELSIALGMAMRAIGELRQQNRVPAPRGAQVHQAVREILHERGPAGASFNVIMSNLVARDMYPSREMLQRWLEADERDELAGRTDSGRWRATSKMEPMVYLAQRLWPEDPR
jgi:hypothetical protein